MRAGLATLRKMERLEGWRVLDERDGAVLRRVCARPCARADVRPDVVQHASIFWLHVTSCRPLRRVDALPEAQAPWYGRFFHAAFGAASTCRPRRSRCVSCPWRTTTTTLTTAGEALVAAAVEAGAP